MLEKLGVMQGRLLPKYQGRYQAHPVGYWRDEFIIAQELGLGLIEFILDYERIEKNPLMNEAGLATIQEITEQTGVRVKTICADYLMEMPLHSECDSIASLSSQLLKKLLINAYKIGVTDIVIPCVDQSALKNEAQMKRFEKNTGPIKGLAEELQINLALETDLPPELFGMFLKNLNSGIFTVNYDTGNSAALGYDPAEELAVYGDRITDIHLKDRLKGGFSVELDKGAADFPKFFTTLRHINYKGPFIMQAYRDDEGIQVFKKQLEWVIPRLDHWTGKK